MMDNKYFQIGRIITEIKWAVIFLIVAILWMFLEKVVGLHDKFIAQHAIYTNIFFLFAIAVYVFALQDKKKNYYSENMTWLQGFASGLIITIFIVILNPVVQIIVNRFISPDFFMNAKFYVVESGKMTYEQAENYFNIENYIRQGEIGLGIMGTIISAIVALVVKTKKKL